MLELSIVIAIIGLLTGGVIAGQKLMESANMRQVLSDIDRYSHAIAQFKEKYEELPGDMTRATSIWGIAGGTGSDIACWTTDSYALSPAGRTCNGNGDGFIVCPDFSVAGGIANIWYYNERFRAWQQMANSGFIEGRYSGRQQGPVSASRSPGYNVPVGPSPGTYYDFAGAPFGVPATDPDMFPSQRAYNALGLLGQTSATFTPGMLHLIDSKADDGLPGQGKYESYKGTGTWQPGCTTTGDRLTSRYNLSRTDRICIGISVIF